MDEQTAAEVVDSTEETREAPSAEEPREKSFTQAEVDTIVKGRIDKQNAKHAEEMAALNARITELETLNADVTKERDALAGEKALAELVAKVAKETGVDSSLLRGTTEEELTAHAEQLKSFIESVSGYPDLHDKGEQVPANKKSNADVFGEIFTQALG